MAEKIIANINGYSLILDKGFFNETIYITPPKSKEKIYVMGSKYKKIYNCLRWNRFPQQMKSDLTDYVNYLIKNKKNITFIKYLESVPGTLSNLQKFIKQRALTYLEEDCLSINDNGALNEGYCEDVSLHYNKKNMDIYSGSDWYKKDKEKLIIFFNLKEFLEYFG